MKINLVKLLDVEIGKQTSNSFLKIYMRTNRSQVLFHAVLAVESLIELIFKGPILSTFSSFVSNHLK